ncbi:MAG: oligosaccharide flippase family protein [Lachnospiraceae bacterium]|jgi:O-antigen/teichoic acid export membrane protein|nr:oligosaccharide flippase family protein [Lachnospiraceae bacterium]
MKYNKALFWNYLSLAVMAAVGLLMNLSVASFYDSSELGIFNETYAWYMILSQISVCGIHMSVLKFVPENTQNDEKANILKTSLYITTLLSIAFILFLEGFLLFMKDLPWRESLQIAAVGLSFFSVNKVFLNYLNAIYKMTAYGVFQSVRYLMLIIVLLFLILSGVDGRYLAASFPITEAILLSLLWIYIRRQIGNAGRIEKSRIKELITFGVKILPSNMVVEMNTKVDVVCLGLLTGDIAKIGVYSFAVLFTDGFYTLYATIRRFINPRISEKNMIGELEEQMRHIKNVFSRYLTFGSFAVYSMILGVYFLIYMLMGKEEYQTGLLFIMIIGLSIAVNGKEIILGDILAQTGHPFEESKLNIVTIASNIILNIIGILIFGTIGAAAATAASYVIYSMYLKKAVKTKIGVEI